jgi:hypothetical protein
MSKIEGLNPIKSAASTRAASQYINGTATSGIFVGIDTDNNSFLWSADNNALKFATNNLERMRIDNAGNVGIGVIPTQALDVNGSIKGRGDVIITKGASPMLYTSDAFDLRIGTNSSERMRIASSGNVGIGTSTINSKLTVIGNADGGSTGSATYPGTIQLNEPNITGLQYTGGLEFKGSVSGSGYGSKITSIDAGG